MSLGCSDPLDNGHHAVELLRQTNLRRVRRKWHAADIDPTRTGVGSSDRGLDCVIKRVRTTLIEEGIGRTIHDRPSRRSHDRSRTFVRPMVRTGCRSGGR